MKHSPSGFSQLYQSALRTHLAQRSRPDPEVIGEIGDQARADGLSMLELAKLHEQFLVMDLLPGCTARKGTAMTRKAGIFFAAVIAAAGAEKTGPRDSARLGKIIGAMSGHTVELAAANWQLAQEIIKQRKVETALRNSERQGSIALQKSETIKEQLRGLSHHILSVQQKDSRKISHELNDVVAQVLLGVNIRLATLKTEAGIHTKGLDHNISLTQKMVTETAAAVHQYARDLHPAELDDLGLIPALHSFMKSFTTRTGVHTHLTVFEGVENLNTIKRTVLYRVAQEALTNIGRHAHACRVEVTIRREAKHVSMEVGDDGKSFQIQPVMLTRGTKRLGLLGMRERVEMVGGCFEIESAPGKGTKIIVRIPVSKATASKWRKKSDKTQPVKR